MPARASAVDLAVRLLYYSGALKLFSSFCARFEPKKRAQGKLAFPFVQAKKSKSLQILVYHRVNDEGDAFFPAVPTDQFAAQMEYLASHCHPYHLQEAIDRLMHNDLPERAVVVTFDDGYRDNYDYAFPILRRFGIPATIFLVTGAIGSGGIIWHDRVFRAFRTTKAAKLDVPGVVDGVPLKTVEEKRAAQAKILQHLFDLADEERQDRIDQLEKSLEVAREEAPATSMLGWDEVLAMSEGGVTFGSHTTSHPILSRLPERRTLEEVAGSKSVIEAKIKQPVVAFAYPVGRKQDFNDRVKAIVKEAGYQFAVTTIFGVNESGQDSFELRRATPWGNGIPSFAARLSWYKFVANG